MEGRWGTLPAESSEIRCDTRSRREDRSKREEAPSDPVREPHQPRAASGGLSGRVSGPKLRPEVLKPLVRVGGARASNQHLPTALDPGMRLEACILVLPHPDVQFGRVVPAAEQKILQDEGLREAGPLGKEAPAHCVGGPGGAQAVAGRCRRPLGKPCRHAPQGLGHAAQGGGREPAPDASSERSRVQEQPPVLPGVAPQFPDRAGESLQGVRGAT